MVAVLKRSGIKSRDHSEQVHSFGLPFEKKKSIRKEIKILRFVCHTLNRINFVLQCTV